MNSIALYKKNNKEGWLTVLAFLISGTLFLICAVPSSHAGGIPQRSFSSPEKAVKSLVTAIRTNDMEEILAILGPGRRVRLCG
ncbi:MAG: DUF2950 family protein [Deltaproteobacteria bacterium]|nr:DUF2950 family protein [Deltaproteobacteria bacterium]